MNSQIKDNKVDRGVFTYKGAKAVVILTYFRRVLI